MKPKATYVYCVVGAWRKPSLRRVPRGLPGAGPVRLLEVPDADSDEGSQWLVVADVPLDRYSEAAINRRLKDLDWVARAGVAHESVVEAFVNADALVPMRLFTIFSSDDRAVEQIAQRGSQLRGILKRVAGREEWGIRVVLDRSRALDPRGGKARRGANISGAGYLARKRAIQQAAAVLSSRSHDVIAGLYDGLAKHASQARRRGTRELPVQNGPLLLDASFLVERTRLRRFRSKLVSEAKRLAREGYRVSLTGPWPPYSFVD